MALVDAVGYFAASCTTLAFLPQAVKVLRDRDTRSLSLGMYLLFTVGVGLWLAYGILKDDYVITLANSITIVLSLAILVAKIRYDVLTEK
ncbi:MAG TPA: SemiSWEET transporter [Desulfuromonadales bacterium]|jgi:MtN3 and saliva related transmembrane protein